MHFMLCGFCYSLTLADVCVIDVQLRLSLALNTCCICEFVPHHNLQNACFEKESVCALLLRACVCRVCM